MNCGHCGHVYSVSLMDGPGMCPPDYDVCPRCHQRTDRTHARCEERIRDLIAVVQRAEAAAAAIEQRVRTIADEAFGPFPVQTVDEALASIEEGIFRLVRLREGERDDAIQRINAAEAALARVRADLAQADLRIARMRLGG